MRSKDTSSFSRELDAAGWRRPSLARCPLLRTVLVYLGRARLPLGRGRCPSNNGRLPSTKRSHYGRIVAHLFADWGPLRPSLLFSGAAKRRRDHSCKRLFPPFALSFGAAAAEGNLILVVVVVVVAPRVKEDRSWRRVKLIALCVHRTLRPSLRDSLDPQRNHAMPSAQTDGGARADRRQGGAGLQE